MRNLKCGILVALGALSFAGCGSRSSGGDAGSPKIGLAEDLTPLGTLKFTDSSNPQKNNEVDFLKLTGGTNRGGSFSLETLIPAYIMVSTHESSFDCSGSEPKITQLRMRIVESATGKVVGNLYPEGMTEKLPAGRFKLVVIVGNVLDCSAAQISFGVTFTPQ